MRPGKEKKYPLGTVVFELTSTCNLDCLYCYNIHKMPNGRDPVLGGYKAARKALKRLFRVADVSAITMSGGEPFAAERFLEVVLYCRMKHMGVTVITNGTKGHHDEYRQLVGMGVSLFELPVHSADAGIHDTLVRSPGAHRKVLRSVESLLGLGATVVPVIVITKRNNDGIGKTIEFIHSLGLRRIMLNRFNIGGRGIAHEKELALDIDGLRRTFTQANQLAEKLNLSLTSNVCTPRCVLDPSQYRFIRFAYCNPNIAQRPITMDPMGNLRICNHSPVIMGNLITQPLEAVFTSSYVNSWKTLRPKFCEACDVWSRCLGGCRAAAEQLGQGLSEVDPILSGSRESPSD